ncbi:phosphoglycerate dehydrogenase [Verruconis gallopava]|uniref:D-3-phosphoglycerate dehydrogenase n=1 Tax=Verruconis gallopava TaxID=253628 RepID=A0A0D2AYQ9_9PEZI|nr:phosphoglycerate dehydrogenase [Verruconis gallopava]KIW04309.1 phosphoglycerate dehydrogenase [Verruconis gallopava]
MPIPTEANGSVHAKPKVLIPEKVSPDGLALLQKTLEIDEKRGLTPEQLLDIIPDYEALIVRSETKVTADLLKAAKKLKVVARAGVGVDNVDVNAATKLGIIVVNSPSGNINAAAEHTIALMMAVARNVAQGCSSLKAGKWERSKFTGIELKGKTLAIVGAGKVGLTVARIANGFGMNCIAYDPYANPALCAAAQVALKDSMDELFAEADFLTIHTPMIASTKGMISSAELGKMKPTARILNVARGGIIDEGALLEALDAGKIAGAGLDVFTSEPPAEDSTAAKLIAHPKVVATPHLGASTREAQENVSIDVCEQVVQILGGALPRSAVNAPLILPEEYRTLAPFVELVERMGSLYTQYYGSQMRGEGKDFRSTFDLTYEGALANLNTTKPLFAAFVKGLTAAISGPESSNVNIVNAELIAKERGILINEQRSREQTSDEGFSSIVTVRARPSRSSSVPATASTEDPPKQLREQVIQGHVSGGQPYISRLGRFRADFVLDGNLLICRNFDSPGKIGHVGQVLGKAGVNIKFMSVAPLEFGAPGQGDNEALMILKVDEPPSPEAIKGLIGDEGVVAATVVIL